MSRKRDMEMPSPLAKVVGERIRQSRLARNLSQMALADLLGVEYNVVSDWETGKFTPNPGIRGAIAATLRVPESLLFNCQEGGRREDSDA